MTPDELRKHRDEQLAAIRRHLDSYVVQVRLRLNEQVRQKFEQSLRELEDLVRANTQKAQRKFEEDMEESEKIQNPVLREANEQFLRSSMDSYIGFQKQLLETFIARWGK